ncbi:MAG: ABC transporter substrate-binding protein, partial [Candidatus Heimdallarchaeaceae archaeon]
MNKRALLGIALVMVCSFSIALVPSKAQDEITPAFYINLLSPNTNPARNQWAALMEQQLPEIGIGIKFHESTGWGNIMPRTWEYPVGQEYDYIPTYDEGGYDILFVGWSWGLDWDPTGLFDTASIVPNGDNMYQYSNPTFDAALTEYTTALDPTVRLQKVKVLQQILYEDLPAITIIYPRSLFGMKEGLTGIDSLLLASSNGRCEYWDDPTDHNITYAIPAELTEYNIYVQESYYDAQWMAAVYGGLFARAQDTHEYEPVIAQNYTVSSDNLNITVNLNPNAKFSDGNPVTAEDIKYTYQLHMTPAVGSSQYGYLTYFFESNDSIEVVDQDTITFHLKQPYAFA